MIKNYDDIVIIIPAYRPDEKMPPLVKQLKENGFKNVLLVNDGSPKECDIFFDESKKYGAAVIQHEKNMGKGRALKTAFQYCIDNYPNMIGSVTADSDGQHSIKSIQDVADALIQNPKALILGVRDFSKENVPAKSQFGNNLTSSVFKMLYNFNISDTQTGLRGISKEFMQELLSIYGERFEFENKMLIKAITSKPRIEIIEVPIETIYDSKENHKTTFNPIIDSIKIYSTFIGSFAKFVLCAISSFLVDIIIFQILCLILCKQFINADSKILTEVQANYVFFSAVISRIFSGIYNYIVNYKFVFESNKEHKKTAILYVLLVIANMFIGAFATNFIVKKFMIKPESLVKVPIDLCLFVVNYFIEKKIFTEEVRERSS